MKKFIFLICMGVCFFANAEELKIEEKDLTDKAVPFEAVENSSVENKDSFKDVQPKIFRGPASTMVPQKYIDRDNNVACYYLVPTEAASLNNSGAAIHCIQLMDPEEKLDRQKLRLEREQDRAKNQLLENQRQQEVEKSNYEENQKKLQESRKKIKN